MGQDAIQRLKNTVIFQALLKAEETGGDHELSQLTLNLVQHVAPLLERIPEKMPEFTLHDPNHSAKVLELMALIMPQPVLAHLNVVELTILITSAYLHDIGMTCSSSERDGIIASDSSFHAMFRADEERESEHEAALEAKDHRAATRIEDHVFVEYLRRNHVQRSDAFIAALPITLIWQGSPFGKWVRAVCKGHGEPVSSLLNEANYPRDALVRNLRINVQYLSILLRLADILDLDPERTPDALFSFINLADPISIDEWNKHRSIIGWDITPERIVFEAECTHPSYERALRTFIEWIEIERRDSLLLLTRHTDSIARRYYLDLVYPLTPERIRSNGAYIYTSMRFAVDHKRIMMLLGGIRLYKDPLLAIRELLQNAVDAVRHRMAEDTTTAIEPSIIVSLEETTLTVEDNGIGMDATVFRDYFIQLGRSYYTSPDFRAKPVFDPVSEFGIGALASFMIAKSISVESRRLPLDPLAPPAPVLFEIPTAFDFFVQRPSSRTAIGTKITLTLRDEFSLEPAMLVSTVQTVAPMLEFPISVRAGLKTVVLRPNSGLSESSSKGLVSLTFPTTDNSVLRDVYGTVDVRQVRHGDQSTVVAQRGFLIGSGHDLDGSESGALAGLFPNWTSVSASLNLRGSAKLALTPDRSDAIRDERFDNLRDALDSAIVSAIRQRLEVSLRELSSPARFKAFVDELLGAGLLRAHGYVGFALSPKAAELIGEFLYVEVLGPSGRTEFLPLVELLNEPELAFTSRVDWPDAERSIDIRQAADDILGRMLPIVIRPRSGTYAFDNFIDCLYGHVSSICILPVAGVVLDIAKRGGQNHVTFDGHISVVERIFSAGTEPVFAHPASPTMVQSIHYNPRHPLIRAFFNDDREATNVLAKELIIGFDEAVSDLIADNFSSALTIFRREGNATYLDRSRESISALLRGFLARSPSFLPGLEGLFSELWDGGQRAGLVADPFPGVTAADFPWYWSEQL